MRGFRLLALAAVLLPAICAAEEKCPWLNAATAAGVLGGAVTTHVTETSCEFVRRENSSEWALRIEVEMIAAPAEFVARAARCGSDAAPLKAIGNEAVACTVPVKQDVVAEQVIGRVRNQAFLVRISASGHSATSSALRRKAQKVAEQIAGFLF